MTSDKGTRVFWKVMMLILSIGACGCTLLSLRQQRLDAVHEMAATQRAIVKADRDLLSLRIKIAQAVSIGRVDQLATALGPMGPIGVDAKGGLPGLPNVGPGANLPQVADGRGTNGKSGKGGGEGRVADARGTAQRVSDAESVRRATPR